MIYSAQLAYNGVYAGYAFLMNIDAIGRSAHLGAFVLPNENDLSSLLSCSPHVCRRKRQNAIMNFEVDEENR